MIRSCRPGDFERILAVINAGAQIYRGVIPEDCWKEPYMPREELRHEIESGVQFRGYEMDGVLKAVMGLQNVKDVTLIRHAYVDPNAQRSGVGGALLRTLTATRPKPILIGTWAASHWAIAFYQKHGFRLVTPEEKVCLLRTYWTVPDRQISTSVVLADRRWFMRSFHNYPELSEPGF